MFRGWNIYLIEHFALRRAFDGDGQFDRTKCRQTVFIEDAPNGGTKRFKSDTAVLAVVLDLAKLCGSVNAVIEHEAKRTVMWYAEHEYGSVIPCTFPHVGEKVLGQRNRVVGRVSYHVVAKRPPSVYKLSE